VIPFTVDQLREAMRVVDALDDPLVEYNVGSVFGCASDPSQLPLPPDPTKVYVHLYWWSATDLVFVVKRYIAGEIMRWHYALGPEFDGVPNGSAYGMPPLATAILMQRLPPEAFPKPGGIIEHGGLRGRVEYTMTGIYICDEDLGSREFPLWRVLQGLGHLP